MKRNDYNRLCDIVYEQSGIRIRDGKMSMVGSRIARRLRALRLSSESAYLQYLEDELESEVVHLLDAISTNVTSFFREATHFELLAQSIGRRLDTGQSRLRVWSAACSTGEEPYSMAMALQQEVAKRGRAVDLRILATDISTKVLETAMDGRYSASAIEPVPRLMKSHFLNRLSGGTDEYEIAQELRDLVLFKRLNLSQPPFLMRGPMDAIFCRNVMIYFDQPVRDRLLEEFYRLLRPDAYLMIGHAETLNTRTDLFERVGPSTYRKRMTRHTLPEES